MDMSPTGRAGLKTYVINLDSRPRNWDRVVRGLGGAGVMPLLDVERIPAVDMTGVSLLPGGDVVPEHKLEAMRRHVSPRALLTMLRGRRRYHHEFVSAGAIGCFLSHVAVWRKVVAQEDGDEGLGALVVEDDAAVTDPEALGTVLRAVLDRRLPPGADVLLVGWTNLKSVDPEEEQQQQQAQQQQAQQQDGGSGSGELALAEELPTELSPGLMVHRVVRDFGSTHMYYVTPAGARKLLQTALPIEVQVDFYMGQRLNEQLSRLMGLEPLVVYGVRNSEEGAPIVHQHNPQGSSIGHGLCEGCGPFVDMRVITDGMGRSRSVGDIRSNPLLALTAAALLMLVATAAVVAVLKAKRQRRGRSNKR
jgi:hypothetical protein